MGKYQWILCPICKNKTRSKMRKDTELKNIFTPRNSCRCL
ncbi:hypothetical protein G4V62_18245 [Bacillaceae bacterium SIJ1]|nr:hypothetical protein [Litoribacterium kuwaitense]